MSLTVDQIVVALQVLIALLAIIVLYHLMFITVDVRKITRRVDKVTQEAEDAILKPIAMADSLVEAALKFVDGMKSEETKKSSKSRSSKKK